MNLRQLIVYSIAIVFFLLYGCSDDPFGKNTILSNGKIRMQIDIQTASISAIVTRTPTAPATAEKKMTNAIIMVFDKSAGIGATLLQPPVQATINGSSLSADLIPEDNCYLCIVANLTLDQINQLLSLNTGTLYSDIQLLKMDIDKNAPNVGTFTTLPMSGWSEATAISSTTSNITIPLVRSVARIDIDGTPQNITDPDNPTAEAFIVEGARLINGAPSGYIFQQTTLPAWDATQVVTYSLTDNSIDNPTLKEKIYCFENKGVVNETPNPTRIIVYGHRHGISTSTWYPIDIIYDQTQTIDGTTATNKTYDIERNKIYTIKFNKVEKDGYRTYEEAVKSEAFNTMVDAEIIVTDPYAYDIVTNGRQYLGVTNAEFVVYPAEQGKAITDLHVVTLSYTCDPNWQDGSITCSSGITLVASSTPRLYIRTDALPTYRDIIVDIASGITEGIITIQVGNLLKEINVRVGDAVSPTGAILDNYFVNPSKVEDFKVGEIINPSDVTSWLKVSPVNEDIGESSLNDKITNSNGGVYLHTQPNIGFEVAALTREASAYIAGDKDNQRIKITVQQKGYDVYSDKKQIKPFTYVGTFHRWNQTGERLIRINGNQAINNTGITWWKATVVAGRDFIVLDTQPSPDPKIHIYKDNGSEPNPYGEGDDITFSQTDEDTEKNQVNSKLRSVEGTKPYLYFRVGLTGKLSGPKAQPRYGLITITYGTSPDNIYGTHNIYVRQGEAPDYLMRPWDASTTPRDPNTGAITRANEFRSSTRPKATKFGVYNLTDPNPTPTVTSPYVDYGARGYTFTQYPSQGGYLFITRGTIAVDPRIGKQSAHVSVPSLDENNPWSNNWETCPKGYRRPQDGNKREIIQGDASISTYPDDIINSEVRQSLWLFPLHGAARSDFSNQLTGYIADGYFDRHPIVDVESDDIIGTKPKGIVRKGTAGAAYCGYLIFNPNNYASTFLPFSGFYRQIGIPNDGCNNFGGEGYILTKTLLSGSGWIVAFGYISTSTTSDKYVFDNYSATSAQAGYAVRCIKDEQPPAITDDTEVEIPTEGEGSGAMVANISYEFSSGNSLQSSIETQYTNIIDRKRIGTLAINVVNGLTSTDYIYLNDWATATGIYAGYSLHHLIIRGASSANIPANSFTSSEWHSISLSDANNIATGAFSSNLTQLKNLSLSYLYPITVSTGAFQFPTEQVQLHLAGKNYSEADLTNLKWKNYMWKSIKKY